MHKTLRDLRRAGVDKDDATRARVLKLREELLKIGQEFGKNIKDDVRTMKVPAAELDGMPDDFKQQHLPGADGLVTITTDNTDYIPFVTYARSARAREELWRLYRLRGHPKNLEVLSRMLEKRHELATLLGYASWAEYATEDKMIGSAPGRGRLHRAHLRRLGEAERARLRAAGQAQAEGRSDRRRRAALGLGVLPGARHGRGVRLRLAGDARLLRVRAREAGRPRHHRAHVRRSSIASSTDAPVWHADVDAYDVFDSRDGGAKLLGRIYLDMHPREGKYKHYAQFTLANGAAGRALPEGVLMCNFPRPSGDASRR